MEDNTPKRKRKLLIRKPSHDGFPSPEEQVFKKNDPDGLSSKQRRFVDEYLTNMDAQAAARKTGLKNADALIYLQNPLVKMAISRRQNQLMQKVSGDLQVTQERVIGEYANLAFTNIIDMLEEHPKQGKVLKNLSELNSAQKSAIKQVDFRYDKASGKNVVKKVKLHSKQEALDSLSKHLGLFEADNRQKTPTIDIDMVLNLLPFPKNVIDKIRLELAKRFTGHTQIVQVK